MAAPGDYGRAQLQQEFDLTNGCMDRLEVYISLLRKWQPKINLISSKTLPEIWWRHILDSAQLFPLMQGEHGPWLDLGSGAGFPGLVLTLMQAPEMALPVHLIESDQRKAIFLREVIRATSAPAQVWTQRIETLTPADFGGKAGLITARALAPVTQILDMAEKLINPSTILLLLKGQDVDDELTLATKYRKLRVNQHQSRTNPESVVLRITEVGRV